MRESIGYAMYCYDAWKRTSAAYVTSIGLPREKAEVGANLEAFRRSFPPKSGALVELGR